MPSTSWVLERKRLTAIAQAIDPACKLVTKRHWFWHALAALLQAVTLGRMRPETFLDRFATIIGPIQAYPASWSTARVEARIVRASRRVRQQRWLGLGISPWVGLVPFAIVYLLLPLPMGLAVGRVWAEVDASRAQWRAMLAQRQSVAVIRQSAMHSADNVASYRYGWSMPRRWVAAWYARALQRTLADALARSTRADNSR